MENDKYWRNRFTILQIKQLQKGQSYYRNLEQQYKIAKLKIEEDILIWYERLAKNNNISLSEAKKLLTVGEIEEFKWSVEEYIKYGRQNAIDQQWIKQLENASAKVHISRLQMLQIKMQQKIEELYGKQIDGMDKLTKDVYQDNYYHTAYEIQKGFNVGWDLMEFDEKQLETVVSKPWTADNLTFRDKCWTNKQQLVSVVNTQITQNIIRGDSPDKAINTIVKQFDVAKNKAGRLVMTESAFFSATAQKDCFKNLNVKQYEIVATLDNVTSELCQGLDGKVFNMTDYLVGTTAPPFHPWCRTCTAPYFDDNFGERAARGVDGKTYYVPSNTKYKDWYNQFVDNDNNTVNFIRMTNVNQNNIDTAKFIEGELALIPEKHRDIINKAVKEINIVDTGDSCFNKKTSVVNILKNPEKGEVIHELAHAIETKLDLYNNDKFLEVLKDGLPENVMPYIKADNSFTPVIDVLDYPNNKFISDYQKYLYELDINHNGRIDFTTMQFNPKVLGEYFAEGYRCYIIDPDILKKKDLALYNFIKEMV